MDSIYRYYIASQQLLFRRRRSPCLRPQFSLRRQILFRRSPRVVKDLSSIPFRRLK